MKKLFLSFAVLFSVALVSCGNNAQKEEAAEEAPVEVVADAAVVEDTVGDSVVTDTVVAVAAETPAENAQ